MNNIRFIYSNAMVDKKKKKKKYNTSSNEMSWKFDRKRPEENNNSPSTL